METKQWMKTRCWGETMKNTADMKTSTLKISGMHCASRSTILTKALQKVDGVQSALVNYSTEKVPPSLMILLKCRKILLSKQSKRKATTLKC